MKKKNQIHIPFYINGEGVEKELDFRFLGVQVDDDLSWTNTAG